MHTVLMLQVPYTYCTDKGARGGAVVGALRYKQEGCGIDSRWCHWNFSLTQSFRPHYCPEVDSASNRNEYRNISWGKGGRCVRLTNLPPPCADCLKNLWASASWNPQGLSRPVMGLLYLYLYLYTWFTVYCAVLYLSLLHVSTLILSCSCSLRGVFKETFILNLS
jgi:hypothetical protein